MNSYLDKKFGQFVEKARKNRKLSQSDLAHKLEVSRATVSRLEQGEHSVSLTTALKIAQILNISLDSLINEAKEIELFVDENFSDKKKRTILEAIRLATNS